MPITTKESLSFLPQLPVFSRERTISESVRERLIGRVMKDNPSVSPTIAEIAVDGAIDFLKLCGNHPGQKFVPSKIVNMGWHAFLMYTREYQRFCQRFAGRFIHHEPNDGDTSLSGNAAGTVIFMEREGISYNPMAWTSQEELRNLECHGGGGSCDAGPGGDCGQGSCNSSCSGDD